MQIPEGAKTVTAEGSDLRTAVTTAATELSLHPSQVDFKLDLSHFRSPIGTRVSRTTVKVVAWGTDRPVSENDAPKPRARPSDDEPSERRPRNNREDRPERSERSERSERPERSERSERRDRPERSERRDRPERSERRDRPERSERRDRPERSERRDRGERSERRERRGPADGETKASAFAKSWFEVVLKHMDVEAEIVATGDEERVHVAIKADKAGRVVGKRGATLRSIRHLLGLAIERQFGERVIDVDVGDDRPRESRESRDDDREERGERRSRDRRGGGGGRDRDRGDRGGRDRDRGDRGDRRGSRSRGRSDSALPEEKLRALARRAAEKARESGQTITINLKLNSYDRRLVHLEVSEVEGADSQSEEREEDGEIVKYVQVIPVD